MEHYNLPHIGTLGSIHTYIRTYIHTYMHTYMCVCVCVCVCLCVCVYIYTHKYLLICLLERSYPMSLADEQCVCGDVSSFLFGNYRAIGARLSSSVFTAMNIGDIS